MHMLPIKKSHYEVQTISNDNVSFRPVQTIYKKDYKNVTKMAILWKMC